MPGITTVYDNIATQVAALLPNHIRLPNPYDIEANSDDFLKQGWGMRISDGFNTQRFVTKQYSQLIGFQVTVTRQAYFSPTASDRYDTVYKEILGDIDLLIKSAHRNHLESDTLVTATRMQGIDPVSTETESYWAATLTFDVEYFVNN